VRQRSYAILYARGSLCRAAPRSSTGIGTEVRVAAIAAREISRE
jgi:hypothetical protein